MKRVGIITYHSAYNYGSVLQAYATQKAIASFGCYVKVINYRMKSQADFYELYRRHESKRQLLFDLLMVPMQNKRKIRINKFEQFINNKLLLTDNLYTTIGDFTGMDDLFDVFVSGSDQIWNIHSNEFENYNKTNILPYFLSFSKKEKIAYASSIGNMKSDEISEYGELLKSYKAIATREGSAVDILEKISNKKVTRVLDPTFLLTRDEWLGLSTPFTLTEGVKYVLVYSLKGPLTVKKWLKYIKPFAKARNYKIVMLTPFAACYDPATINAISAGPLEFIHLINNAEFVVTDSFHGTAFSINFNKDFVSIGSISNANDTRRNQLLDLFNLRDRLIPLNELKNSISNVSFNEVNAILNKERKNSIEYLKSSLLDDGEFA